ncbi:MAG: phosphate ABC transporter, permease protein PstA, partial [Alphaproteobacteria bacterium]|nr:phosphate ABC transporter, permease protein PstA [Alphaproteobacteria bacterium]
MAIARIFGEAAPLILVGSVAFIANAPSKILDPIPLMPTQIYLWTQNIDTAFIEKSFGAIIILLFINLMVSIVSQRLTNKSEGL